MPHIKSKYQRPSGSGEDFKIVFTIYGHGGDQNILHIFWLTYHKESSHEILVQLGQRFMRKLCFNILVLMGLQNE